MANMFDEIPATKQGIISYRNYAVNQIHESELMKNRMERAIEECNKRLDVIEKGEKQYATDG